MIAKVAFASKVSQRSCSRAPAQHWERGRPRPHSFSTFMRLRQIAGGAPALPVKRFRHSRWFNDAGSGKADGRRSGERSCYFSLMIGWSGCAGFGIRR